jgi:hypothetical protein
LVAPWARAVARRSARGIELLRSATVTETTSELVYSPEHQRVIGRIVIGCSRIEAVAANIAARLRGDDADTLSKLGRMMPKQVREDCRKLVSARIEGQLRTQLLDWLDRADAEAAQRNEIAHAIWLRVDKPKPGTVAYAHFGPQAADRGYATVEQVELTALDRIGMEMESVADIGGLYLLAAVEDYLAGTYVEPSLPPTRG